MASSISLFIYIHGDIKVYILVYVDDILVTGNDSPSFTALLHSLGSKFSVSDLSTLDCFLGIEAVLTKFGLLLITRSCLLFFLKVLLLKNYAIFLKRLELVHDHSIKSIILWIIIYYSNTTSLKMEYFLEFFRAEDWKIGW